MKTLLRRFFFITFGIVLISIVLLGCSFASEETGTLKLSLTDAPIADAAAVEGVYITISSIQYNQNDVWIEDTNFEGPQTFNLLDLTGGTVTPLSNTEITAGEISQIRFMLDVQEDGSTEEENPGSYIVIDSTGTANGTADNDVIHELFVPSGEQTGYKATGSFTIPANGEVEITADFDVRKSVVKRGVKDEYILKPTIRLVVNNQAGTIAGSFTEDTSTYSSYIIFAYEDGEYATSEAPDGTEDDTFIPFGHAISSASADLTEGSYTIPFLAAGTYDLIIVGVDEEGVYTVIDETTYSDVAVESELTEVQDITLT
jgi:hypothetical protein